MLAWFGALEAGHYMVFFLETLLHVVAAHRGD